MIYTVLTALIILLAKLRRRVRWWRFREDRDLPLVKIKSLARRQVGSGFTYYTQLECCDCGLTHGLYVDEEGFVRTVPRRPRGYGYKLRGGR